MASLKDLYTYYCRRCDCRPNSAFCAYLDEEYERNECQRILRTVDVSSNYLGKKGIIPVLDLVKNMKTVEELDVSNNRLEHEELEHLVYCLLLHPTIHTVSLRDNCLHDGSIDHIVKLLETNTAITSFDLSGNRFLPASLTLVEECLARNVEAKAKLLAEEKVLAAYRAEMSEKRSSFTARVEGSISEEESGGHLHFATWWKNPQYRLCVSRRSRVSLVLRSSQEEQTKGTRQAGIVVLRFDGVRRVIDLGPRTVVAESPVSPDGHCCLEIEVSPADQYVVVPFTFQPGRSMDFTLAATLLFEQTVTLQEEGWVTLDALDQQYDWHMSTLHGSWTKEAEGGGGSFLPTWRHNPMFRVRYSGKQRSGFWAGPADVHLLLYKALDGDDNDEKEIGLDVVRHDHNAHGHPPLVCTPDLVLASHPHQRRTAVSTSFTTAAPSLDVFVVPSTKQAHQAGEYTLVVFSAVPVSVTTSQYPHGWNHRVVEGEWNAEHCGGCRDLYASWKNNLAYKVLFQSTEEGGDAAAPSSSSSTTSGDHGGCDSNGSHEASRALMVCLEVISAEHLKPKSPNEERMALVSQQKDVTGVVGGGVGRAETTEGSEDPDESKVRTGIAEFKARHTENRIEMCVAAVNDAPPSYPIRRSSAFSSSEAQLLLPDTSGNFLIVPMARHAGQAALYQLHLYSATPFLVADGGDTLVERERAWQLSMYVSENEARCSQAAECSVARTSMVHVPALRLAAERRHDIAQQCESMGLKFSDRDFPRGSSSLWLDPEAKQPFDFPKDYEWRRVTEICADAICLGSRVTDGEGGSGSSATVMSPPYPYGKRAWFASVVNALAAKPHWLQRIFGGYDAAHGLAQFYFHKGGAWTEVVVDDYLPVDSAGLLCLGHSTDPKDFLYPLAEKAFAKLHRCYEALERKVTPELSLSAVFMQALEDVSGGLCTTYHLRDQTTPTCELNDDEKDVLWRKLKEASKTNALHALLLRSDCPGATERKHAGILLDSLYAVIDARFVEQRRLVKVRNWRDGADTVWKGKWTAESSQWTETLRTALEFADVTAATPENPQTEYWMSFDEVVHYFTDLLVTEEFSSRDAVEGSFGGASGKTYAEDTDVRLRAPQYALQVSDAAEGCGVIEVTVGLHRADARMSVTRAKEAVAKYRYAVGLAVFATHDNRRHVKVVEDSQVWRLQTPVRSRDIYLKVLLDPRQLDQQQLTIMPFCEHEKDAGTAYLVSASSNQATVRLDPVDDNMAVRVTGAWEGIAAGGPPTAPTWRDNPQFFLYPSECMEVTISLVRAAATDAHRSDAENSAAAVGFTVHTTRSCSSFLHFVPTSVIVHGTSGAHTHSAQATITLAGLPARRGMPYVLVPYCSTPGITGNFTLTVIGNKAMRLSPVEPRLDWNRARHSVRMRAEDGSAGGSPRYPSWRCSPQVALTFPVARAGRLLIAAANRDTKDSRTTIGLMVLRGDGDPHFGGTRRRLLYDAKDVVAVSEEDAGRVELEIDAGAAEGKTDSDAAAPLILAIFTTMPYREADVDLAFYAEAALEVAPVKEWKHTALMEGSWELGQTAGGNRRQFASWINNPFVGLATVRPTSVVALLVQYPRASEQPIVKRLGNRKAFLPPPITNPDRQMTIELDLVHHDDDLTAIEGTGPSRDAETAIAVRLPASGDGKPYILVPVTTVIDQDADYKLFVYADQPIDLFAVEKQRLWYV